MRRRLSRSPSFGKRCRSLTWFPLRCQDAACTKHLSRFDRRWSTAVVIGTTDLETITYPRPFRVIAVRLLCGGASSLRASARGRQREANVDVGSGAGQRSNQCGGRAGLMSHDRARRSPRSLQSSVDAVCSTALGSPVRRRAWLSPPVLKRRGRGTLPDRRARGV